MIKLYTDGSARGNGSVNAVGAWGFIAVNDSDEIIYKAAGGVKNTTNNQMELQAIIEACKWAQTEYDSFTDITIFSDSAYCINAVQQKWYVKWQMNNWRTANNGDVKNIPQWKELIPFFENANYSFKKVKGHSTNKHNCEIDEMVQAISATLK